VEVKLKIGVIITSKNAFKVIPTDNISLKPNTKVYIDIKKAKM
jgi:hypothetical protein